MHFLGCETFYEIYDDLKKLNYIAQLKKIKIMVKLHPNISYLKGKLAKKFTSLSFSNEKIEKILKKTVLTISFSSTTIEDSFVQKFQLSYLISGKDSNIVELSQNQTL